MFPHPTKVQFRNITIIGLLAYITTFIVTVGGYDQSSQEVADAVSWSGYGALLPDEATFVFSLLLPLMILIGLVGMILFRPWSRYLITAAIVLELILSSFMGLNVYTGVSLMLITVCGICTYIPLTLSFFEPCSHYFTSDTKTNLPSFKPEVQH